MVFGNINIGVTFHAGKSYNLGAMKTAYGLEQYLIWEKIDKSKAKCVNQIGYGNTRQVGDIKLFSYFKKIFLSGEKK